MTNISWNTLSSNTTEKTIVAAPYYAFAVFLSLTQLLGVLGNVLVIYSIVSQRSLLKSNYYYLVLHLAFCDLMVLVLYADMAYHHWFPNSPFIPWLPLCKVLSLMRIFFFNAGVYMVVLIGILRYRAVLHPFKPAVRRSKLRVVVAAVYLCALTSVVPLILVVKFTAYGCYEEWPNPTLNIIYTYFLVTVQYFLPVVILFILYYKICKALKKQSKKIGSLNATSAAPSGERNGRQTNLQRIKHCRNIRTFIYSVGIVVSFAITWFPVQITWLMLVWGTTVQRGIFTWAFTVGLFGVNAVNPYIYGVSDKTLLSAYKRSWKKVKGIFVSSSNYRQTYTPQ